MTWPIAVVLASIIWGFVILIAVAIMHPQKKED
jgi:hypothetical protein